MGITMQEFREWSLKEFRERFPGAGTPEGWTDEEIENRRYVRFGVIRRPKYGLADIPIAVIDNGLAYELHVYHPVEGRWMDLTAEVASQPYVDYQTYLDRANDIRREKT